MHPTPEHLTVRVRADGVAIEWQQTDETSSVRYSMLRGTTTKLANAQPIPAIRLSSTSNKHPAITYYTLIDQSTEAESAYVYWLVSTNDQGQQATFGPYVVGRVGDNSEQNHALFLPLIGSIAGAG